MRILIVVHGLPPESTGGTELAARTLARGLAPRHDVTLLYPLHGPSYPPGYGLFRREQGVRLIGRAFAAPRTFEETWRRADVEAWFVQQLERYRPDLCHLHHLSGLSTGLPALARARDIPVILTLHDYWLLCARGQRLNLELTLCPGPRPDRCASCLSDQIALDRPAGRLLRPLLARFPLPGRGLEAAKRLYWRARPRPGPDPVETRGAAARIDAALEAIQAATLITAPSRDLIAAFRALVPASPPFRFVDHGFAPRGPAPPPPPEGRFHIGFVGALIPTKAPHLLIESLERLSASLRAEARLTLVGPAPQFHRQPGYADRLIERARALGATVLGPAPPEEIPELLRTFHVLVLPSIWPENAPLVIAEALREGVPVIASNIGGIPERVADGVNGRLFPAGDVGALTGILERYIADPGALEPLRDGAWRTPLPAETEQLETWERLYHEVCGG